MRAWTAGGQDLPFESFCEAVLVGLNLEDLDGLVGGACGQSSPVVVEDGVVLGTVSWGVRRAIGDSC